MDSMTPGVPMKKGMIPARYILKMGDNWNQLDDLNDSVCFQ
jgi:hypothetical protein